jgi:hypothetical protein
MIKLGRVRLARHAARMEVMRNAYKIFVGKPERRREIGRPSCKWKNNIEIDLD